MSKKESEKSENRLVGRKIFNVIASLLTEGNEKKSNIRTQYAMYSTPVRPHSHAVMLRITSDEILFLFILFSTIGGLNFQGSELFLNHLITALIKIP